MFRRIINKVESIYQYRYLSRNEKASYNFLLKNVFKGTDIEFLEKVWQLDHFREVLDLQEINKKKLKKVLILAPHQDDEVIGCGGLLKKLVDQGSEVHIGFLTDGAELSNPIESVVTRRKEAENLCNYLKVGVRNLEVCNINLKINKYHIETLTSWFREDWDAIFTVWPVDHPPKHRLCAYMVGKALKNSAKKDFPLYLYGVHTDVLANFYEDITDVIDEKADLINFYPSQMQAQRYDHLSRGLDAWRSRFLPVSNEPRFIETFFRIPIEAYDDFQSVFDKSNINKLFKGHEACIRSFHIIKKIKN
ncbi:PIG-L family deacetylase [Winogradskyella sp. F6397]|uniref:PIG-L family deacetylase n=1 Tax=Winogradskyella marina TaxID=2785530 RepID=A0ABS0EKN2_9FLAO|nr:PIG-L deacetylase family protein [Winogradskyella marina]MBF8150984.1 PIG-L family deacetylase [Winogradskyella marina]